MPIQGESQIVLAPASPPPRSALDIGNRENAIAYRAGEDATSGETISQRGGLCAAWGEETTKELSRAQAEGEVYARQWWESTTFYHWGALHRFCGAVNTWGVLHSAKAGVRVRESGGVTSTSRHQISAVSYALSDLPNPAHLTTLI